MELLISTEHLPRSYGFSDEAIGRNPDMKKSPPTREDFSQNLRKKRNMLFQTLGRFERVSENFIVAPGI